VINRLLPITDILVPGPSFWPFSCFSNQLGVPMKILTPEVYAA